MFSERFWTVHRLPIRTEKVKLNLDLVIKQHAMKTYGGVEL
jgi:hypothetical protein